MTPEKRELLPCPFCGNVPTSFYMNQGNKWGGVQCCIEGPEVRTGYDESPDAAWHADAIREWNRRTEPKAGAVDERKVPELIVTRGDGVPLPDQVAAVEEFKRQALQSRPASEGEFVRVPRNITAEMVDAWNLAYKQGASMDICYQEMIAAVTKEGGVSEDAPKYQVGRIEQLTKPRSATPRIDKVLSSPDFVPGDAIDLAYKLEQENAKLRAERDKAFAKGLRRAAEIAQQYRERSRAYQFMNNTPTQAAATIKEQIEEEASKLEREGCDG